MLRCVEIVPLAHHPCLTMGVIVSASHLGPQDGMNYMDGRAHTDRLSEGQSLELRTLEVPWHKADAVGLLSFNFPISISASHHHFPFLTSMSTFPRSIFLFFLPCLDSMQEHNSFPCSRSAGSRVPSSTHTFDPEARNPEALFACRVTPALSLWPFVKVPTQTPP